RPRDGPGRCPAAPGRPRPDCRTSSRCRCAGIPRPARGAPRRTPAFLSAARCRTPPSASRPRRPPAPSAYRSCHQSIHREVWHTEPVPGGPTMQEPEGMEPDSTEATTEPEATTETEAQPGTDGEAADATAADGTDNLGKKGKKGKKLYRELAIIVVAAVVLTLLVKAFVVQVYRIPSASMENTLLPGDRVLVNKLVYHFRGIDRGDVIVFSGAGSWGNLDGSPVPPPPSNPVVRFFDAVLADVGIHNNTTYYIKRVIGLPGDHVACCTNGLMTVNGVPLHETGYI